MEELGISGLKLTQMIPPRVVSCTTPTGNTYNIHLMLVENVTISQVTIDLESHTCLGVFSREQLEKSEVLLRSNSLLLDEMDKLLM